MFAAINAKGISLTIENPDDYYAITMVSPFASKIALVKHIRGIFMAGGLKTRHLASLENANALATQLIADERVVVCPNPNLFADIAALAPSTLADHTYAARRLSARYMATPMLVTQARTLVRAMRSAGILTSAILEPSQ